VSLPGGALLTTRAGGNVWSYPNLTGDVAAVANQSGVKQGATTTFDPFGNVTAGSVPDNSAGNMDYGWKGQHLRPLEQASGLVGIIEMGARQYSPVLGRFIEVDPVEGGGANDYAYPHDRINMTDLNGEGGFGGHCGSMRGKKLKVCQKRMRGVAREIRRRNSRPSRFQSWVAPQVRRVNVSFSVCPVFGCVQAGLNGGRFYTGGGAGLAVSSPGFGIGPSTRSRSGWSSQGTLFGGVGLQPSWNWEGQDLRKGAWGWGLQPSRSLRGSIGGGYVHMWNWSS